MQLVSGIVLPTASGHQESSVGRHRRVSSAALSHSGQHHGHHGGSHRHQHHDHHAHPGGILEGFLCKRTAPHKKVLRTVPSAAAVATTATSVASQQQQVAPDLGYPRTLVADYVLLQTVGKGGNGVVVLAQRRDEQAAEGSAARKFAVKSIPKVLKDGSELKRANHLAALQREITVLKRLRGSLNIISLEGVYEDDTHVHLVMEYCAGGELTAAISTRHHSERAVASYMRAVLRTLAQCHAHHILHRDIKPGNFMLLGDDERAPIRAIDFGLATPFDPEELPCTNLGLEGTPWFMAPEVLSSKVLPASDLWSAGVMCFQLLTGRMPFDDRHNPTNPSINAIWRSILFDEVDFLKPWWRGISPEAKDFVRLLLQRDPALRPTAKEALKHPWLVGDSSDRSAGKRLQRSVVARIQRFAGSSVFKRSVLQMIALELQRHPECDPEATCSAANLDGSGSTAEGAEGASLCNPVPPSLEQLYRTLSFDPQTDDVADQEVALALKRLGFRLTDDEVERLLEQLDPARTGRVSRAALAASQMDWRQLQRQDTRRWVALARRVFSALDTDADGVLEASEVAEHVLRMLPGDEAELAELVKEAMQEAAEADALVTAPAMAAAGQVHEDEDDDHDGSGADGERHPGGGYLDVGLPGHYHDEGTAPRLHAHLVGGLGGAGGAKEGINFEGFLRLLKANSLDSLDMYDDRTGGASLHSIDRLNAALQRSGSTAASLSSGSRHGTRHGALGSLDSGSFLANAGSVHGGTGGSTRRSMDVAGGANSILQGKENLWRFDVGGGSEKGGAAAGAALTAGVATAPIAVPAKQAVVWRFDVAGPHSDAPAKPAVPVWRFDVGERAHVGGGKASESTGQSLATATNSLTGSGGGMTAGSLAHSPGAWRFDVGERSQSLFGDHQGSAADSSHDEHHDQGLALVTAGDRSGGGERSGMGGRGPLGGWFDARQHGSKLYATALSKSKRSGVLPPVDE